MAWKVELFDIFFVQKWSVLSYLFSFEYCTLFKSKDYRKHELIGKFKAFMLSIAKGLYHFSKNWWNQFFFKDTPFLAVLPWRIFRLWTKERMAKKGWKRNRTIVKRGKRERVLLLLFALTECSVVERISLKPSIR